nr:histidine phosphatase family protein [uncultured Pseudodesulfovibrio sp.]
MIVLMRHAQTEGGAGRCIGRTPVPLSDAGRERARHIVASLRSVGFKRLCASPAQRAQDTLDPLARVLDMTVETLPALNEIDMGKWDGLPFEDVRRLYADGYAERGGRFGSFRPPLGESFMDVADRALVALNELAHGALPVLVATHAGVLRSVLCRVTGHPMDDLFHFKPDYAHCVLLRSGTNGLELIASDVSPDDLPTFFDSNS